MTRPTDEELIKLLRELGDSAHTLAYIERDEEGLKQRNLGVQAYISAKLLEMEIGKTY